MTNRTRELRAQLATARDLARVGAEGMDWPPERGLARDAKLLHAWDAAESAHESLRFLEMGATLALENDDALAAAETVRFEGRLCWDPEGELGHSVVVKGGNGDWSVAGRLLAGHRFDDADAAAQAVRSVLTIYQKHNPKIYTHGVVVRLVESMVERIEKAEARTC